jgi:hypothetical protein
MEDGVVYCEGGIGASTQAWLSEITLRHAAGFITNRALFSKSEKGDRSFQLLMGYSARRLDGLFC